MKTNLRWVNAVVVLASTGFVSLGIGACAVESADGDPQSGSDDAITASREGGTCGYTRVNGRRIYRPCQSGLTCLSAPSLDPKDQGQVVSRCVAPRAASNVGDVCGDWVESGVSKHVDCASDLVCATGGEVRKATCIRLKTAASVGDACGMFTDDSGARVAIACGPGLNCSQVKFSSDGHRGTCR